MSFRILDLFCGAGGFSKGFDEVKEFETVEGTDFNKAALETFKYNFPNAEIVSGDITSDDVKDKIISIAKEKKVNMVIGGPPCQGFSNKGKKLGLKDPRNFLFLEYLDIISKLSPEIFVIENVKTILTAANGYFLEQIKQKISDLGYYMDYNVMKAIDFGVPQKRERAIIVACKNKKINLSQFEIKKHTTVREAISDLDYLNSGEGKMVSEYQNKPLSRYQQEMRKNSNGKLYNHIATSHSDATIQKLKMIPPEKGKEYLPKELWGNQKFKTTWGRLKWDSQSPTIDTRFDTPSNGTNTHPVLNRTITPREAARIQSFPDDFVFIGKKSAITKQIGNAVPPLMAKSIAELIKKQVQNDN